MIKFYLYLNLFKIKNIYKNKNYKYYIQNFEII